MPSKSPTTNEIKAVFQLPTLDRIVGEPSYDTIRHMEIQVIRNATTIEIRLPPPHTYLSGLVEQDLVYQLRTGRPFPRPNYPGYALIFPVRAAAAEQDQLQEDFLYAKTQWELCLKIETLLRTQIKNVVEAVSLTGIHTDTHGFRNITIQVKFQFLYTTYQNFLLKHSETDHSSDRNSPNCNHV